MHWHITGDSFVEGIGGGAAGGWAQRFARTLPDGSFSITGIGGSTTTGLVQRLPAEIAARCNVLVIAIGINDSRYRPSLQANETAPELFRENLRSLVSIGRETATAERIFLIGLTRVDEARTTPFKPDKIYRNAIIAEYDTIIRNVAEECANAGYVEVPSLAGRTGCLVDGLHPSPSGHRMLFDAIVPVLRG